MILVVLLYAVLALSFTLAKAGIATAQALYLVSIRMIVGGLVLLPIYLFRRRTILTSTMMMRDIIDFAQVILFHIYLSFVPEFWAMQFLSSIKVNIMYATTPFITMILAYLLYREKMTIYQVIGSMVAFAGLLPLMARGEEFCLADMFAFEIPELVLLGGICSAAYAWFVIKRLMNRGYSLLLINGISMLVGGCMSLATWYVVRPVGEPAVYHMSAFVINIIAMVLLANIFVYNLYGWLLRTYSVSLMATAGFLSPIFGAIYGNIFLNEPLGWQHLFSIAGIAIGLYLFFNKELSTKKQL